MTTITIGDLVLQPIPATQQFAEEIYDIFSADTDSFKYWFDGEICKSADDILHKYQEQSQNSDSRWKTAMYGIFKNGELLGEIGLSGIDTKNQTGEIGYWLKKSARGHGIITKLIPVIEKLGFEEFDLRKIDIWCDNDNVASRKHAEKQGYILEGIQRERKLWPDGSVHSTAMFGKLKSEWEH